MGSHHGTSVYLCPDDVGKCHCFLLERRFLLQDQLLQLASKSLRVQKVCNHSALHRPNPHVDDPLHKHLERNGLNMQNLPGAQLQPALHERASVSRGVLLDKAYYRDKVLAHHFVVNVHVLFPVLQG